MLSGVLSNYDTYFPQSRDIVRKGGEYGTNRFPNAKAYRDVACKKVQRRGIARCQDCQLDISECPAWSR